MCSDLGLGIIGSDIGIVQNKKILQVLMVMMGGASSEFCNV
jgi:hypothetical protein